MATIFPDKNINYAVYRDGNELIGTATVDLPELSYMTDSISGAGLAGEIDSPVTGHFQSMTVTLNWRTIESEALKLLYIDGAELTLRSSQQQYDSGSSKYVTKAIKIVLKTLPKTMSLGSLQPAASTDSTSELEVIYIKIDVGGETMVEIDKLNFICNIGGTDVLSQVRTDLGK